MNSGISSDAVSLMAISLGALVSVGLSAPLLQQTGEPTSASESIEIVPPALEVPAIEMPKSVIDFAIIRSSVEVVDIMAGPEDERSGWSPPPKGLR